MTKRRLPQYRDITSFGRVYLWLDNRGGASALVGNDREGATREDLARLFRIARSNEITITSRRPFLVYGTHCPAGETASFRFVQVTSKELAALEGEVRRAR